MAKCPMRPLIVAALGDERALNDPELRHVAQCVACEALVVRAQHLERLLAGEGVTDPLPSGTLEMARLREIAPRRRATRWALSGALAGLMLVLAVGAVTAAGAWALFVHAEDAGLDTSPEAFAAFRECVEDAGISRAELASLFSGTIASTNEHWPDFERCLVESGIGRVDGDSPEEIAAHNLRASLMADCLRASGWDVRPVLEPRGRYLLPPLRAPGEDPWNPQFFADMRACAEQIGIPVADD